MGTAPSRIFGALIAMVFSGCVSDEAPRSTVLQGGPAPAQHHAAVHGMLLFGSGPIYLSHLPLFHRPHDWQMILEAEMVKPDADALATYVQDRKTTGEKVYTVVPEPFVLTELLTSPNGVQPVRSSFRAAVVRGHFERGGSTFMTDVTFKVKRVVTAKQLKADAPALPALTYLLFGNELELFGAHVIQSRPDFDHVVSVRVTHGVMSDAQAELIRQGAVLTAPAANVPAAAFGVGDAPTGTAALGKGEAQELTLQVLDSFYLETGDLEL